MNAWNKNASRCHAVLAHSSLIPATLRVAGPVLSSALERGAKAPEVSWWGQKEK